MFCPTCGFEMLPLFFTAVCEYCEAPPSDWTHHGYVVWSAERGPGAKQYVFPTQEFAEHWRTLQKLDRSEVRKVLAKEPFRFRQSRGSVKELELADALFEVYPDHRFKPAPDRVFLAPAN